MQSLKNSLFHIPKLGKILLLASGLLIIGGGIVLKHQGAWAAPTLGASWEQESITFENINAQYLKERFSKIHFSLGGNDFGGGIIWLPTEELSAPQSLQINGQSYNCTTKIRGYYYNSQRGERVWPLDEKTRVEMGYNQRVEGGRYTNCKTNWTDTKVDPYGIYGSIKHIDGLGNTYILNAGIKYNINANQMESINPGFQCNLQRLNNQFPFGYLFDNAGGIWLLGASVKNVGEAATFHNNLLRKLINNKCLVDLYSFDWDTPKTEDNELRNKLDFGNGTAEATIFKLGIRGIVGVSNENRENGKEGNESQTSVTVKTDNSISQILNITKKNAEHICKGKWQKENETRDLNKDILCIEGSLERNINQIAGKTVIIKEGNLTLNSYLTKTDKNNKATTVYLMKGNLFLPPGTTSTWSLATFLANGYLDNTNNSDNPKAAFLKGNFIINGLIAINGNTKLNNKLIVHGKIASLNTLETPSQNQSSFIRNISNTDEETPIILSELFGRYCDAHNGLGSDETPCKADGFITDKAFSLIDMNFPSPLFQ